MINFNESVCFVHDINIVIKEQIEKQSINNKINKNR